jgi:hypothetical protein
MRLRLRAPRRAPSAAVTITLAGVLAFAAPAGAGQPQSTASLVLKECGACHIAYQPWLLPAPAWGVLMDHLDTHFGEQAVLPPGTAAIIREFYTSRGGHGEWAPTDSQPLPRITQQPWWKRAMGGLDFKKPRIKSKANCGACHSNAAYYLGVHN